MKINHYETAKQNLFVHTDNEQLLMLWIEQQEQEYVRNEKPGAPVNTGDSPLKKSQIAKTIKWFR